MGKMIELMRQNAVPANVMRSAARGALTLPPAEALEILVFLAGHHIFGEQAKLTLAAFDVKTAAGPLSDPNTPRPVLEYFWAPENRRLSLLKPLFQNPAIPTPRIAEVARTASREVASALLASERVMGSSSILRALEANPVLTRDEIDRVHRALEQVNPEAERLAEEWLRKHAGDIAAEEGKEFRLVGDDEAGEHPAPAAEPERLSVIQKLARMTVGERVQAAMKGSKDERFVLIRDGSKVVSAAVLQSPKLSEQEVESFAAMKNVQESVLRGIAANRKFAKNYVVLRNLVNNPRCPLDVSLTVMKNLLAQDLKVLSQNKNVSETLRKLAMKQLNEKNSKR